MTYEQLTESPFCLDYGTKVEIEKKDGTRVLCHFGGYRTASAKIIDKAQEITAESLIQKYKITE